jgi:opacity protein-like surface antigen
VRAISASTTPIRGVDMATRAYALLIAVLSFAAAHSGALAQEPVPAPASGPEPTPAPARAPAPTGGTGWNEGTGPAKKISIGLLLGYGVAFEDFNPYGFGLGIRGGYNLRQIYLGARFVYNVGNSEDVDTGNLTVAEVSYSLWDLGLEAGYDLALAPNITVRPEVGLGLAGLSIESEYLLADADDSTTNFYFALGGTGLYDIRPNIFVGLDVRFQFVFADDLLAGMTFLINGGMRF